MVGTITAAPMSESQPFWAAAARGTLLLRHCADCDRTFHYPRSHCPLCGSSRTEWRTASGRGIVYTCSVTHRADPPYCIAYVALEEGPIVLTNIVNAALDAIRIGQRVQVVFIPSADGRAIPMFEPAAGGD